TLWLTDCREIFPSISPSSERWHSPIARAGLRAPLRVAMSPPPSYRITTVLKRFGVGTEPGTSVGCFRSLRVLSMDPPRTAKPEIHLFTAEQTIAFLKEIKGDRLEALYTVALALRPA